MKVTTYESDWHFWEGFVTRYYGNYMNPFQYIIFKRYRTGWKSCGKKRSFKI